MWALGLFLLGLAALIVGAEVLTRGASRLATSLGISPMVIGLTIVSLGTSAPELAVGITASRNGQGGLAIGNIAGTNVMNLLFILCLSALIRPLPLQLQIFKLELPVMVVAALMMLVLGWDGVLSPLDGLAMLIVALIYSGALIAMTRRASRAAKKEYREEYGPETLPPIQFTWKGRLWDIVLLFGGISMTVIGADWLVQGAVQLATAFGVSDTIIGLTIVAFGTSAPELVTTIVSTIKNDRDVAVGNLLGSSIYNILVILAITCLVTPSGLLVADDLLRIDIPLMTAVAVGAIPVFLTGRRISRWEGGLGLAIYAGYMSWLIAMRA